MENTIENIEQAVSLVQTHLEQKQNQIETENNIEDELNNQTVTHQVLSDKYFPPSHTNNRSHSAQASYLDLLDEESKETVYELLSIAESKGIPEAMKRSAQYSDFIVDAFRDVLVRYVADSLTKN